MAHIEPSDTTSSDKRQIETETESQRQTERDSKSGGILFFFTFFSLNFSIKFELYARGRVAFNLCSVDMSVEFVFLMFSVSESVVFLSHPLLDSIIVFKQYF